MPVVSIRSLNSIGRFGNSLFLYVFAKAYAQKYDCRLEVPFDWIGRKIFVNATEAPVTHHLVQTPIDSILKWPLGFWFGQRDLDVRVFAQSQIYCDFYTRKQVREWLTLKPEYEAYAPPKDQVYSAAHLRRGDYQTDPFLARHYCTVSDASYDRAIQKFGIPEPVHRVCEGWMVPDAELIKQGLSWLQDFLLLRDADYLLRANSSFSWFASVLGDGITYSPEVGTKAGLNDVEFVQGNHPCTAGRFRNQSDLYLMEE